MRLLEYQTFAVKLLAVGEREILVQRLVGGAEAIVPISEDVTLEDPDAYGQPGRWKMTMPTTSAKECGLVE